MNKIVHYIGLDVHKDSIAVAIAPQNSTEVRRLMEALRLRVQDVDFGMKQLIVRDGKGAKDRFTVLPETITTPLKEHLQRVQLLHQKDLAAGGGSVYLPGALERKYPNAAQEWR